MLSSRRGEARELYALPNCRRARWLPIAFSSKARTGTKEERGCSTRRQQNSREKRVRRTRRSSNKYSAVVVRPPQHSETPPRSRGHLHLPEAWLHRASDSSSRSFHPSAPSPRLLRLQPCSLSIAAPPTSPPPFQLTNKSSTFDGRGTGSCTAQKARIGILLTTELSCVEGTGDELSFGRVSLSATGSRTAHSRCSGGYDRASGECFELYRRPSALADEGGDEQEAATRAVEPPSSFSLLHSQLATPSSVLYTVPHQLAGVRDLKQQHVAGCH
ncbi:hypothetical protein BCR35DRAFT_127333 [Leucosporidium creatinivorum]|uniref:Uncharacterized protein n=1 Tax=Leucosporidium creatinivorum TaxID=106004 RepID=A0A1Y2EVU4_9BASI|nr:hypothetical protein BCR35DRAFT_127333 [Leucosporidium creatinivorum]